MKLNIFVAFHTKASAEVQGENLSTMHLKHIGSSKQRAIVLGAIGISRREKKLSFFKAHN